jgi:hypothetical protein
MKPYKFIRIISEGEKTEPNYFRGIIKAKGIKGAKLPKSKDNSPMGVVKTAKKEMLIAKRAKIPKEDIEVWAVFDKDGHAKLPEAIKMAKDNGINIAFSNICFEFWILLHFERCTKPFHNCDEIIKYIRKKYDKEYLKKDDHFARLQDKIENAIDNNDWLITKHWQFELQNGTPIYDINPYTDVYKLVKLLMSL